jgi:hypothetical protein
MPAQRRIVAAAAVTALFIGLQGCAETPTTAPPATTPAPEHVHAAGAGPHSATVHAAGHLPLTTAPLPVREQLQMLLGQHSTLTIRLMRGQLRPAGDFADATAAALGRNTDELTAAVRGTYSAAGASRFRELWVTHISALTAYAAALQRNDGPAQRDAKAKLATYNRDYGKAIAELTGNELPAAAVTAGVQQHVDTLIAGADAYARGDWEQAYTLERDAFRHMFDTGKQFAGATVSRQPGELPAGFDDPPASLRSALGMLLGEHMELTVDATRAIVTSSPEEPAAVKALDANSRAIAQAFTGALGSTLSTRLVQLWADHVDAVVTFAEATRDKDAAAAERARADLRRFAGELGRLLRSVAKGKVDAEAAVKALDEHDEALLRQTTAFAAADYRTAHDISYSGYQHMFAIAGTLTSAVRGNLGGRLPVGGAATGYGPVAGR